MNKRKGRTACNVEEDLSDVLHVRQRLERIQPFLDNNSQSSPFVLVFFADELGVIEQTCDLLVGRIRIEDDVLSEENLRQVVEGPFSGSMLCLFDRRVKENVLRRE